MAAETQRYRIEKFTDRGTFLEQRFIDAWTQSDAEIQGERLTGAQPFREAGRGRPYIHVTLSPHQPSDGQCTRCGEPRYRCGGEADPHE